MISKTRALAMTLFLIAPLTANSGVPAARQTDTGQTGFHAGSGIVTGSSNVLIGP